MTAHAFPLVLAVAAAAAMLMNIATREILYFAPTDSTDEAKQVRAAARWGDWKWPSEMHRFAGGKAWMKDVGVLGLAIMQRVLRDREGLYPLVVLCHLVTAACAVLIFIVARSYWGPGVGLMSFALFLSSVWPYHVALAGGYQCLAVVFLLVGVVFLQRAPHAAAPYDWACYAASGFAFGLMLFSSASSRKLISLYLGAFLASQWALLFGRGGAARAPVVIMALLATGVAVALLAVRALFAPLVTAIYEERAPGWLNGLIRSRERPLRYYLDKRDKVLALWLRFALAVALYAATSLLLSRAPAFYEHQLLIAAGLGAAVFLFTFPHPIDSALGYWSYWSISKWGDHFPIHDRYFRRRIGRSLSAGSGGLRWVARFYWRVAPFHAACFIAGVVLLFVLVRADAGEVLRAAGIAGLGLLPIVVSEVSGAPKSARAYFPTFIGVLLVIAYAAFVATASLPRDLRAWFWLGVGAAVLAAGVWTLRVFLYDVWPARMSAARVAKRLKALGVRRFYTYDTPYNDVLVRAFPAAGSFQFEVEYIDSLRTVTDGYVVVPGTSAKAWNWQSSRTVLEEGDFSRDPILNELIDTRAISSVAIASFETFGTSKIWVNDGDVMSYRDLILGEITAYDRWRGRAWILDAAKVQAYLAAGHGMARPHPGPAWAARGPGTPS